MWLRLVAFLLASIALLSTFVILAWLTGRIATDRWAWSQWLWWIPTPAALAACLLGLVASLRPAHQPRRRRNRVIRWLACGFVLLIYFTIIEHRFLRAPAENPPGLTIAHWNMTGFPGEQPERAIEKMITLDADITIFTGPAYLAWQPRVVESLSRRVAVPATTNDEATWRQPINFGPVVLLTRLPVIDYKLLVGGSMVDPWIVMVKIDASSVPEVGRPIVLYMVDLPSDPRIARMAQARRLRGLLDNLPHIPLPPDVVVGDFNTTRSSASLSILFPNLRHAFNEAGHGYGATFHRAFPLYHIDHMLLGSTLRAVRYDIIDQHMARHHAQKAWIAAPPR